MKSLVLAGLCLIFSAALYAQIDSSKLKTTEISLDGGTTIAYLPQDFRDTFKGGWHAGGSVGMTLVPGSVGFGSVLLNVDVNRFAFDYQKYRNNLLPNVVTTSRNPTWAVSAMATFRGTVTALGRYFQPYFLVGVGYAHISRGDIVVSGDVADTTLGISRSAFGWTAGVGFDIPINDQLGIFVEGKSVLAVIDPQWQWFPVGGGIRYRIGH